MKKQVSTLAVTIALGAALFSQSAEAASVQVKKGDTLWGFSRQYGTSVSNIKQVNGLNNDIIYVGQTVTIPESGTGSAPKASSGTYIVKSGDSLWLIANNFSTSVSQLKAANNLSSDIIYPGQTLKLTAVAGATTSTPSPVPAQVSAPATSSSSSLDVNRLISTAKSLIGTPYVWGGTSPSGFDCSGFIYYVINKQKPFPRLTTSGYWAKGSSVAVPQAGDFVFFETYAPGPSHMGIYLGDGKFISAGSSRGVEISSLNNPYWSPRYLGAKRL
jgi:peptidoglycan DL-endopeptidase LytE